MIVFNDRFSGAGKENQQRSADHRLSNTEMHCFWKRLQYCNYGLRNTAVIKYKLSPEEDCFPNKMITTSMKCCWSWCSLQVWYTQTRRPRLVVGDRWSIDLLAIWRGLLKSMSWTFYGWNLFIHLKTSDRTVACCLVSSTATLSGGGSDHHSDKLKMATGFMSNCGWKGWWIVLLIERSLKKECFFETCYHSGFKYFSHVRESEIDILWWRCLPRKHFLNGRFGLTYLRFVSPLTLRCCVLSWWRKFWGRYSVEEISIRNILIAYIIRL